MVERGWKMRAQEESASWACTERRLERGLGWTSSLNRLVEALCFHGCSNKLGTPILAVEMWLNLPFSHLGLGIWHVGNALNEC